MSKLIWFVVSIIIALGAFFVLTRNNDAPVNAGAPEAESVVTEEPGVQRKRPSPSIQKPVEATREMRQPPSLPE